MRGRACGLSIALAVLIACGGGGADGEAVDRLLNLQSDWGALSERHIAALCGCWDDPATFGYSSEQECVDGLTVSADEVDYIVGPDCLRDAYSLDVEAATAHIECEDAAKQELDACESEASSCVAVHDCIAIYADQECPWLPGCIDHAIYQCAEWKTTRPEWAQGEIGSCEPAEDFVTEQ